MNRFHYKVDNIYMFWLPIDSIVLQSNMCALSDYQVEAFL